MKTMVMKMSPGFIRGLLRTILFYLKCLTNLNLLCELGSIPCIVWQSKNIMFAVSWLLQQCKRFKRISPVNRVSGKAQTETTFFRLGCPMRLWYLNTCIGVRCGKLHISQCLFSFSSFSQNEP